MAPTADQAQPINDVSEPHLAQLKREPVSAESQGEYSGCWGSNSQSNTISQLQTAADQSPRVARVQQLNAMMNRSVDDVAQRAEARPARNNTGLPDRLKTGLESLSGFSMDAVKVHYNSNKPAQLNAHAYAQGSNIHLAPGQSKHLHHEAWHVVQQMQGRVKPTTHAGDVAINDSPSLEREADMMGAKALSAGGTAQAKSAQSDSLIGSFTRSSAQLRSNGFTAPPVVQRVLVNGLGQTLSSDEIQQFKDAYPGSATDIQNAADSMDTFAIRGLRSGVQIVPFAPPSSRSFRFSLRDDMTTTSSSDQTNREAARSVGMSMSLSRTSFPSTFTSDLLSSDNGPMFEGADKLSGGMSLSEAGLDRTHHLSDSSIRIIVEWLHENRGWQTFGVNWVISWMQALTGASNVSGLLDLMGTTSSPPSNTDLNSVVNQLSNNTNQVGFGDSETNQKVVGPFFDASKTPSGFTSPLAAGIQMATMGLRNVGVPDEILEAALAEVVSKKSGKTVSSMTFNMPPPKDPPWGGGGGFGGGPPPGSGFGFGGVTFV